MPLRYGWRPLHRLAGAGNAAAIKALLAAPYFADPLGTDAVGRTALHVAALRGFNSSVAALVEAAGEGALDSVDDFGWSARALLGVTARGAGEHGRRDLGDDEAEVVEAEVVVDDDDAEGDDDEDEDDGGWGQREVAAPHRGDGRCEIAERTAASLGDDGLFLEYVLQGRPVMVRGGADADGRWRLSQRWSRADLLAAHGAAPVEAGPIPYHALFGLPGTDDTLAGYVGGWDAAQGAGDVDLPAEAEAAPHYIFSAGLLAEGGPMEAALADFPNSTRFHSAATARFHEQPGLRTSRPEYQFFLGPPGSGAPPHYHSDAWNALAFGRKRWFLQPPDRARYGGRPASQWVQESLPKLKKNRPIECTQEAGDLLYVPASWGHVTLNLKASVGVAGEFEVPYWMH